MAQKSVATAWVNNTLSFNLNNPARIYAVEIQGNPVQGADAWLQIYNNNAPTLGTTAPDIVIPIMRPNVEDGKIRQKILLGGLRLPTAFSWFVSSAANGSSAAPVAANSPLAVAIFYNQVP